MRGLVGHPLRSVLRNRQASATALAGLVIGVAIVAAPWVALDSSLRGVMEYRLRELLFDAHAWGPSNSVLGAADELRRVPRVERVEPHIDVYSVINQTLSGISDPGLPFFQLTFVAATFPSAAPRFRIENLTMPPPGSVAADERLRARGLEAGDPVVFESRRPLYGTNGTYLGDEVRTATYTVSSHFRITSGGSGLSYGSAGMFLPLSELANYEQSLNVTEQTGFAGLYIWLDRGTLLDPFDPVGSASGLRRQINLMQGAIAVHGFTVQDAGVIQLMESLDTGTFLLRLLFGAFAIPSLVIAGLLGRVGFDVGAATRRREMAVFRARGLSARGVKLMLLGESCVLAIIATAFGLLVAVTLSRFLLVSAFPGVPAFLPADVGISSGTAILALLFALLLTIGSARRASRWLATDDLVTALKAYAEEEASVPRRPSRDFLLGATGTAGFLLILVWASFKDSPVSGLTFLLGFSTAILAPFAPFLLMIAVARYLTRGTTAPYRILARMLRGWLGELHDLVDKNLVRAPRRSSNAAAIVTLAVAFVVGVSVLAASADAYREEGLLRYTPSDVIAETFGYSPPGSPQAYLLNASNQAAIRAIPGVRGITIVAVADGSFGATVLFNASTYLATVSWVRADHLGGVNPSGLMEELRRGSAFAANRVFQSATGLLPGDVIGLGMLLNVSFTGRLAAIVTALPGLYLYSPDDYAYNAYAYADLQALGTGANLSLASGGRYLIALEGGADSAMVKDAVASLLGTQVSVRTLDEAREAEAQNSIATATFSYLHAQALVAVVLLGVTVGLFVFTAFAERRNEFATMIARGAGTKVVWRLLAAEGWVVAVLGIVLGTIGGLLTVATFFALISSLVSTSVPFVLPLSLVLLLPMIAVAVWLASLLGAFAIRRMDVARVLKLRGG